MVPARKCVVSRIAAIGRGDEACKSFAVGSLTEGIPRHGCAASAQTLGELDGERRQAWVDWVKQYRAALQAGSIARSHMRLLGSSSVPLTIALACSNHLLPPVNACCLLWFRPEIVLQEWRWLQCCKTRILTVAFSGRAGGRH